MPVVRKKLESTERRQAYALRAFYRAAGVKDEYTEEDVRKAVKRLEAKYKPSYVAHIFDVAKRSVGSWPPDIRYSFSRATCSRIALRAPALKAMISAAKSSPMEVHRGYLLLSTLYGLRPIELRSVRQEDVSLDDNRIFVRTAKGGIERNHLIPESVKHYLCGVRFSPMSEDQMWKMYRVIEAMAGIEHMRRAGWHSIRRAVATALTEVNVNEVQALKFLRWKDASIYHTYVRLEWRKADAAIFEVHPFLKLWEAKNA